MARPKAGYRLADEAIVTGATSIIGCHDHNGLIHAAWKLGTEGKDYKVEWYEKAANAGTYAHELIEKHVKGEDPILDGDVDPKLLGLALKSYEAFKKWASMSSIEVVATEMPLVSEVYRYGGTPDGIAMVDGQACLLDYKSGSYNLKHIIQAAAYRHLWNENNPKDPVFEAHVLRVGKEYADFSHHYLTNEMLDLAWEQFKDFRRTYERHKQLRKMVA